MPNHLMMWPFSKHGEPPDTTIVFTAKDRASLLLARSLLEDAGIRYVVNSDFAQDIFPWGRIGTGWSVAAGPPTIMVNSVCADAARSVLEGLGDYRPSRVSLVLRVLAAGALIARLLLLLAGWLGCLCGP